jgi:hypothetical protein
MNGCSEHLITGHCTGFHCLVRRLVYRMDFMLPAARRLLYALHEERKLYDVVILAALSRLYNLPAFSSDPISFALLISA